MEELHQTTDEVHQLTVSILSPENLGLPAIVDEEEELTRFVDG